MQNETTNSEKRKGWIALIIIVAVLAALYAAVPRVLMRLADNDLRGIPERTAAGVVENLQSIPNNPGGGDDWNAVDLRFDGRKVFYSLPRRSRWSPLPQEQVTVRYRIGRSGVVQIDSVEPADAHPTYGPVR
jgi:hypothetical protein